jgi:hypothetical protein
MRNICSSPKYEAGGWKIQNPLSVRLKGTMTIGRLIPYPGQDSNPRSELTFVRTLRLTILLLKHFALVGTIIWI